MLHVDVLERTQRGLRPFVQLPFALYRDDGHWVPPVKKEQMELLLGQGSEWLKHAECAFYLAYDGERPIARVMAGLDTAPDGALGRKTGFISLFEAENADGARAVLDAATAFMQKKSMERMIGPLYPAYSVLNRGILVAGEAGPPVLENAYNPLAYADYLAMNGFEKARDYLTFDIAIDDVPLDKWTALAERAQQRFGFELRGFGIHEAGLHLARDIAIVLTRALDAEGELPLAEEDILALFDKVRPVSRGEVCVMAYAEGEPVGVVLSLPDNSAYLKALGGTDTPVRRLLARFRQASGRVMRCPMQAVVPAYQNKAVNLAMICRAMRTARALGYRRIEGSPVAEDDPSAVNNTRFIGGTVYRRYRVYSKAL